MGLLKKRTSHKNDNAGWRRRISPAEEVLVRGRDVAMSTQPKHWLRKPRHARLKKEVKLGMAKDISVAHIYTTKTKAEAEETRSMEEIVPVAVEYSRLRQRI